MSSIPNSEIIVPLIAGKSPFTLTCHSKETFLTWYGEMEAATVLILPQLVLDAENYLEEEARDLLSAALIEQMSVWKKSLPEAGDFSSTWKWVPSLGI